MSAKKENRAKSAQSKWAHGRMENEMTEEERAALAWLEELSQVRDGAIIEMFDAAKHATTLKAMLARPLMPEEPSEEVMAAMRGPYPTVTVNDGRYEVAITQKTARAIYAALRSELMKPPPPKMAGGVSVGLRWARFTDLSGRPWRRLTLRLPPR